MLYNLLSTRVLKLVLVSVWMQRQGDQLLLKSRQIWQLLGKVRGVEQNVLKVLRNLWCFCLWSFTIYLTDSFVLYFSVLWNRCKEFVHNIGTWHQGSSKQTSSRREWRHGYGDGKERQTRAQEKGYVYAVDCYVHSEAVGTFCSGLHSVSLHTDYQKILE